MAVDVATLSIKVDSTGVKSATNDMNAMERAGDSLLKKMMGFASFAAFGYLAKQMFDTNAEFQRLNASLITVEGSADKAQKAFKMLQSFATNTPYELTEVTQAFIDLKVRGMDASQQSLTAYGDMASSFGRSLGDTIRAIAGVTVGENEAIKSFGVTAQNSGDRIALTFRGQTEIIKKSTAAVEEYFKRLAEKNYGGGMERQMNTLGGVLSNLKDQIAATFFAIGNSGIGSAVIDSIKGLTQALADVTPALRQFASDTVSAFMSVGRTSSNVVKFLWEWKTVILALAGIAFAATINAWIASLAAMAAPTIQAIALTAALELSTIKYATTLGIAQIAATGFKATMTALLSPAGALTVGIIALTVAMSHYAAENAKIDEQQRKSEGRYANTWGKFYELVAKTKEMAEERKRIEDSLATGKPVEKGQSKDVIDMVEAMKKAGKSEADVKKWVDGYNAESKALQDAKDKLEAHNKAVRESADESKRREQERKSFIKGLKEEYDTYGMTTDEILKYKAARLGLANSPAVKNILDLHAFRRADIQASMQAADEADLTKNTNGLAYQTRQDQLQREIQLYQDGVAVVYPYQQALEQLGQQYEGLVYLRDTNQISQAQFIRGEEKLVSETRKTLPVMTDMFGDLRDTINDWSRSSTDAFVEFCFTAKNTFGDLVTSMLKDLARLAVQKSVMDPLFSYAATGISAWLGSGSGTDLGSGSILSDGGDSVNVTGSSWYNSPDASVATASPVQINAININAATGKATTDMSGQSAAQLSKAITGAVQAEIVKQKRTGGLLA